MRIDVLWTPAEREGVAVQDRTVVVVDVLRAASTIATAVHNGARAVVPADSTEEAIRIATSLGRDDVLLCGERQGMRVEGFDLGNSPSEFEPEAVRERTIVLTTTNGTRALADLGAARAVYVAALVNLSAVAQQLRDESNDTLVICAGRDGRVSVDDALCAGMLVDACASGGKGAKETLDLGDGALAATGLVEAYAPVDAKFLMKTAAGRSLRSIGQGDDIETCARLDSVLVVPVLRDRKIVSLDRIAATGGSGGQPAR